MRHSLDWSLVQVTDKPDHVHEQGSSESCKLRKIMKNSAVFKLIAPSRINLLTSQIATKGDGPKELVSIGTELNFKG